MHENDTCHCFTCSLSGGASRIELSEHHNCHRIRLSKNRGLHCAKVETLHPQMKPRMNRSNMTSLQNKSTIVVHSRCRSRSGKISRGFYSFWSLCRSAVAVAVFLSFSSFVMADGRASVVATPASSSTTSSTATPPSTAEMATIAENEDTKSNIIPPPVVESTNDNDENNESSSNGDIKIIFSDLDGTLIHYPGERDNPFRKLRSILEFPKSSTGKVGVISAKTLSLVDEIRSSRHKVKFVLISGMRTSTLLQRLPYLPRADAYCSENGGRIFYPVVDDDEHEFGEKDDDLESSTKRSITRNIDSEGYNGGGDGDVFWVHPRRYKDDGASGSKYGGNPRHRNKPFGIREDKAWREKMTTAMGGGDAFGHFTLTDIYASLDDPASISLVPLNERDGPLWDFARDLIENHGFVVDTKGYSTCFRINKKQQISEDLKTTPPEKIAALLKKAPRWAYSMIASSVNLSCVDFYPSCSGKKNCCLYLASKFFPEECQPHIETEKEDDDIATGVVSGDNEREKKDTNANKEDRVDAITTTPTSAEEDFLSNHAVCMCDDDNDLEMALACQHAYLPDVASESMRDTIARFPNHFTLTFRRESSSSSSTEEDNKSNEEVVVVMGTDASDRALSIIWERVSGSVATTESPALRKSKNKFSSVAALVAIALAVVVSNKDHLRASGEDDTKPPPPRYFFQRLQEKLEFLK